MGGERLEKREWGYWKRMIPICSIIGCGLIVTACSSRTTPDFAAITQSQSRVQEETAVPDTDMSDDTSDETGKSTLIVYYSYSGNTELVAKLIQEKTGGDLYEIETVQEYSGNSSEVSDKAAIERETGDLPELKGGLPDVSAYEQIFAGGPVWTYTVSTPLMSYLAQTDFAGKEVIPFWTDAGTPGDYEKEFMSQTQNAVILPGLGLSNVGSMEESELNSILEEWLNDTRRKR
ncbi:flavodoxin [Eisenbergiella sp.]